MKQSKALVDGNKFVPKNGLQSKRELSRANQLDPFSAIWRRVRSPFLLPEGVKGHTCTDHYEIFDCDKAGCLLCGKIHSCSQGKCPVVEENDSTICTITGFCVRECQYALTEFTDTVSAEESTSNMIQFVESGDVYPVVSQLLLSGRCADSHISESTKLIHRQKVLLQKFLKEHKLKQPHRPPNWIEITTKIANQCKNHRLCNVPSSVAERKQISRYCSEMIARMITAMRKYNERFFKNIKLQNLIIGLLYLMRNGLKFSEITFLPQVPQLQQALPLESHLQSHFQVRCKVITEIENLVKIFLRTLSKRDIEQLGVFAVDQLLMRPVPITASASSRHAQPAPQCSPGC